MRGPEPMTQADAGAFSLRRFAATRISRAIEDDLRVPGGEGIVEGVHRSAVNIRWGDGLLTVAHESVGGLPNGILIEPPIALDQIGIAPGMPVQCDGAALRLPGASTVILLSGAASWSPAIPVVRGLAMVGRVARAEAALGFAADLAPRVGLGPLLVELADDRANVGSLGGAAARSLADVIDSLGGGNVERALAAAFPLIGLGPGATPAGDDLLVGFAAGLAATDHPLAGRFASGVAHDALGMTTSVAECYLIHAGRLEFSERVHTAALAVLSGSPAEVHQVVMATLAWGASSGADLMVGLLVGVQATAPGLAARLRACASDRNVAA